MEVLGTLAADLAHEISNPVNTVTLNIPVLKRIFEDVLPILAEREKRTSGLCYGGLTYRALEDNLPRLLADIQLAGLHIAKIVTDLKNLARKSDTDLKTPLQLNEALEQALRLARPILTRADTDLTLELADNLPATEAHLQSVQQVILNLIINAAQAIDHPPGRIRIRTALDPENRQVRLSVSDNGRGISPAIAERMFEPFVTDKESAGGTGIGLSVAYSLVKAHGGAISGRNNPETGATFTMCLPALERKAPARVLIVDDDESILKVLLGALARDGRYLADGTTSSTEALIRIGTRRPDLLVLDVLMPEMDGAEVCRAIRSEPELASMKVLVITGYPGNERIREIRDLGFDRILPKPFGMPAFLAAVEALLDPVPAP